MSSTKYLITRLRNWCLSTSDPRVLHWPLMGDPLPLVVIWFAYVTGVVVGPRLLSSHRALSLKPVMLVYNAGIVCLSVYMTWEFGHTAWQAGYSLYCQPIDWTESPLGIRMARVCWWFFFSKVIELSDTMFFILRKKHSQVTFLHVYHHSTMIWNWWLGANFVPGGHSFFNAMLNSGVHVVMYSYYFLSLLGPALRPYLFWKRYLTQLQLVQFVSIIVHTGLAIFVAIPRGCDFPPAFCWHLFLYCITMIFLFGHFYVNAYLKSGRRTTITSSSRNGKHQLVADGDLSDFPRCHVAPIAVQCENGVATNGKKKTG